ncbi:MAG: catechol 1,2-dioxygenase [Cyclobacteriaceae bacterium]
MKRRKFTKLAGLSAVAVSTSGFIQFNGTSYEGDCETTTDILGPFYRPNSPVRDNLVIKGAPGDLVELSGVVRHKDCQTPYKEAKVELWHCSAEEIYDNDSEKFLYRGTTYCDENGKYKFTSQMPVPYDVGDGTIRPAHFHIMVSAPGYQSLITQIYFVGDPYLQKDAYAANGAASNRILKVTEANGINKVNFDCNMNDKLKASYAALNQIVGTYKSGNTGASLKFFSQDDLLWMKNEVFGRKFEYIGNNEFEYPGMPTGLYDKLHFDVQGGGKVKLTRTAISEAGTKTKRIFIKA